MSKALKAAIEANDPEAARRALQTVNDVNRKLSGAAAPLLYASAKGADKVLELLFAAGAVAEKKNTFPGDTPFAVAAKHGQFAVMKRLLELKQASDEAVQHVLDNACIDGESEVVEFVLKEVKPPITIQLFRLASVSSKAPAVLKLLVQHGGEVDRRYESNDADQVTALHELAGSGKPAVLRTLIDCGANVNAPDSLGRTPLMILASRIEGIERGNEHALDTQKRLASGEAKLLAGEGPRVVDYLQGFKALLESGANATLVDNAVNDAIDHCVFEYFRCDQKPPAKVMHLLREAGAKGSETTLELFLALKKKDLTGVRSAIKNGGDVNRLTPPPVPLTPLTWAAASSSDEGIRIVRALLEAGADPNKPGETYTPLIRAVQCGNFAVAKELVAAGADIHRVCVCGEMIENAYSAADDKPEIRTWLKSLGATNPRYARAQPWKTGVASWNDFSEVLVKATVEQTAEALARLIKGKAHLDVYGQSFVPGKRAYVVVRPKGMAWCNAFQIAPPRPWPPDEEKIESFATSLAKECKASVLSIEYSDTSDAASTLRIEPDGKTTKDAGWDRDILEEMVGAMGNESPAWAKKQLARTPEDALSSTEQLEKLAEEEKFVVAAFGFGCEPGETLDVEIAGYGKEDFDGAAFVSD